MSANKYLILFLICAFISPAIFADAKVVDWQKSATVIPTSPTDFGGDLFKQSLSNLRSNHADFVTLIVPWYQSNNTTAAMGPGPLTPTDATLTSAINYAHSIGLKVNLKPHQYVGSAAGWRANLNPPDKATWFKNYESMLAHYANIAQKNNVEQITIGTELINMTSPSIDSVNTSRWQQIISNLRKIYSGKLTYSANWGESGWHDEKNNIEFWDQLDSIGISAYFYLTDNTQYTMQDLQAKWDHWNNTHIKPLAQKHNKPIIFTEVGYRSIDGALQAPPRWQSTGPSDEQEQADGYEALLSYWDNYPYVQGIHWWDWNSNPNGGGSGTTSYTPQNKLAESVMAKWYGGGAPIGSKLHFSTIAILQNPSPKTGETVTIIPKIKNTGSIQANITVNFEIYNSKNQQVFQKFFENEAINAGEEKSYLVQWAPSSPDSYKLKAGVFSGDWSTLYYWGDNVLNFSVAQADTTPISIGSRVQVIGVNQFLNIRAAPSTTSSIIGTQPKGSLGTVIDGPSTSNGTTFWRVNYDQGADGWSNRNFLTVVSTPSPTPTPTPTPPADAQVEIWWPTDGATVSGTQPFKAMVSNTQVENYEMFWQVDGGGLNYMRNEYADYPHKESWVDLSGWNWHGSGPYTINFVAKQDGRIILQKSISILTP